MEQGLWALLVGLIVGFLASTARDMFSKNSTAEDPLTAFVRPSGLTWILMILIAVTLYALFRAGEIE